MPIITDPYTEGHKAGSTSGYKKGHVQGYSDAAERYERIIMHHVAIINKYKRFLDRLGIKYNPYEDDDEEEK